jgi:hypothetical protein
LTNQWPVIFQSRLQQSALIYNALPCQTRLQSCQSGLQQTAICHSPLQYTAAGNAAVFLLIRKMTTDKVLVALRCLGGTVIRSSFDETKEQVLHAALAQLRAITPETVGEYLSPPSVCILTDNPEQSRIIDLLLGSHV